MIHLEHVSKCYSLRRHEGVSLRRMIQRTLLRAPRSGFHFALTDVSLDVERGASIAVLGVNGCGKTTLLKLMSGVNVRLEGFGKMDGKYTITQARHRVSRNSGYGTEVDIKRVRDPAQGATK